MHSLWRWRCFEAGQSLATGAEGVGTQRSVVRGRRGRRGRRVPLAESWSAPGEPSAFGGREAQALDGSGEGEKEGDAPIPKAQECGARSSGLVSQSPSAAAEPHPRGEPCRGRGELRALPGGQDTESKAIPVTAPLGSGLSGFLFGEKTQQNPRRQNGEEERAGLVGPGGGRGALPQPRPEPRAPVRAVPAAGVRKGRRASRLCAPINLPGGRRAGWGLFVTLLPRSPRSPGSGLRRSLPLAAAASAGAICCCRFWRSAIQKQTSSMTTNSYSQMY